MKQINRLKVVLVEQYKTRKCLAEMPKKMKQLSLETLVNIVNALNVNIMKST